jgi:DHA1 family tetracycline resistance protein-like MFS transporter
MTDTYSTTYSTRNANMLLFASQIVNIGFGLLAIFITLLADEISLKPVEIGIVISIFMVARAISAWVIPGISDNIGRKTILVVALFTYAFSTMMLGFARDFSSLFILRIIEGASAGAVFPTAEALLVDSVPADTRGAWLGKYFTTFNLGFILGPAIGGLIFTFGVGILNLDTLVAFTLPFIFTGILGFTSLLTTILLVEDVYKDVDQKIKLNKVEEISDTRTPYIIPFLIVAIFSGFSIGLVIPIFTLYMSDSFLLTEGTIGFLFTISGTCALLVNYPAGRLSDKLNNRLYIVIIGTMISGLGFIGVSLSTSLIMVIVFFIVRSMAFQALLPAYRAFQADKIPLIRRATIMGRISSAFNFGAVFGPLIGGALYEILANKSYQLLGLSFYGGGVPFMIAGFSTILQVFIIGFIIYKEGSQNS